MRLLSIKKRPLPVLANAGQWPTSTLASVEVPLKGGNGSIEANCVRFLPLCKPLAFTALFTKLQLEAIFKFTTLTREHSLLLGDAAVSIFLKKSYVPKSAYIRAIEPFEVRRARALDELSMNGHT